MNGILREFTCLMISRPVSPLTIVRRWRVCSFPPGGGAEAPVSAAACLVGATATGPAGAVGAPACAGARWEAPVPVRARWNRCPRVEDSHHSTHRGGTSAALQVLGRQRAAVLVHGDTDNGLNFVGVHPCGPLPSGRVWSFSCQAYPLP